MWFYLKRFKCISDYINIILKSKILSDSSFIGYHKKTGTYQWKTRNCAKCILSTASEYLREGTYFILKETGFLWFCLSFYFLLSLSWIYEAKKFIWPSRMKLSFENEDENNLCLCQNRNPEWCIYSCFLPRYSLLIPRFSSIMTEDSQFQTTAYLPNNACIKTATGNPQIKRSWAIKSSCLAAIIAVHKVLFPIPGVFFWFFENFL